MSLFDTATRPVIGMKYSNTTNTRITSMFNTYDLIFMAIWWLVCGFVGNAILYAWFQNEEAFKAVRCKNRIEDYYDSLWLFIILGPFGLLSSLYTFEWAKHGWRFIPYPESHYKEE